MGDGSAVVDPLEAAGRLVNVALDPDPRSPRFRSPWTGQTCRGSAERQVVDEAPQDVRVALPIAWNRH